jgi:hypothetical protein
MRTALYGLIALLLGSAPAVADPVAGEETVETIEVKNRKLDEPDHPSLRFLRDNRVFLRAQLDRLRLETRHDRRGEAWALDPRYLRLKEMAAAIAAARDTVDSTGVDLERRHLLTSVTGLGDLESQLDLMDSLLSDQRQRLLWLEEDFLGRQETALVVLVRGHSGGHSPTGLVLAEEHTTLHVDLTPAQQASLQRGGIVQIDHRLVEPRDHVLTVGFTGPAWAEADIAAVEVAAPRDRLTFLELDLATLDPAQPGGLLTARVWQR